GHLGLPWPMPRSRTRRHVAVADALPLVLSGSRGTAGTCAVFVMPFVEGGDPIERGLLLFLRQWTVFFLDLFGQLPQPVHGIAMCGSGSDVAGHSPRVDPALDRFDEFFRHGDGDLPGCHTLSMAHGWCARRRKLR